MNKILCECGCGEYVKNPKNRFIKGHVFNNWEDRKYPQKFEAPPKCKCGCGNTVIWNRWFKRWNKYINHHNSQDIPRNKKKKSLPKNFCKCGCGKLTNNGKKYVRGHNCKGMKNPRLSEALKINNPMDDPKVREKHQKSMLKLAKNKKVQEKRKETLVRRYGVEHACQIDHVVKTIKRRYSKCHRKLFTYLKRLDTNFEKEQPIQNTIYIVDILNENIKLAIECYGDYWHCNPKIWRKDMYHDRLKMFAFEKWGLDQQRESDIKKAGYAIMVFWEFEINHDFQNVIDRIVSKMKGVENDSDNEFRKSFSVDVSPPRRRMGLLF